MHPRSSRPTLARRSHAKSRPTPQPASSAVALAVPAEDKCTIQVILPRRKAGQPETERESEPVVLNRDVLESLFHLPLAAASGKLGLSATSIKKVCRRMGIIKWPYKSCRSGSKRGGAASPTSSENSAAATPPHNEHEASQHHDEEADEGEEEEGAEAAAEEPEEVVVVEEEDAAPEAASHHPAPTFWEPALVDRGASVELMALDACYEEDLRTTQILDEYVMHGGRGAWADGASAYSEAMRADEGAQQCLGDFLSYKYLAGCDYVA